MTARTARSSPGPAPGPAGNLLHLVDEPVKFHSDRVIRLVAEPGAELVVVVVLDPRGGQELSHASSTRGGAGAAVQQQHLQVRVFPPAWSTR